MAPRLCPICKRPQQKDYAPFCSRRCSDLDLQRWFSGAYVIPGEAAEDGPGPGPDAPDGRAGQG